MEEQNPKERSFNFATRRTIDMQSWLVKVAEFTFWSMAQVYVQDKLHDSKKGITSSFKKTENRTLNSLKGLWR